VRGRIPRPRRPRALTGSLRNKVALAFCATTALAIGVIFFYVTPQLESNLQDQRVRDLARDARASPLEQLNRVDVGQSEYNGLVRAVADSADAQLTILQGPASDRLFVVSDSRQEAPQDTNYGLARRAVRERRVVSGVRRVGEEEVAQVAQPLFRFGRPELVALYSRSLKDTTSTVSFIRARVLVAGLIALLVALAGGYLIARALARRVRRLEEAAGEVAAGKFIEPLPVDSEDELGQLTRTFNEMQEQLVRVDRSRREFIANASHELRTPIFSLAGFAELLDDEELDDETRAEFVRTMREQIRRLQKLAVDLLDLSRLDAGSLNLQPEDTDLGQLAREVAGEFTPALGRHRSELELRLPDEQVAAWCDRGRVAQIMRILLDNALAHTPEGTSVTVTAERENGAARFAVADTGPGVEEDSAERLFERFHTADAARGSGLGLAIAKELAERMDGKIDLDSRPGRTVFTLGLPAAPASGGPDA